MRSRPPHPVAAGTESDAPSDPRDPGSGNEHMEALLARHLPRPPLQPRRTTVPADGR